MSNVLDRPMTIRSLGRLAQANKVPIPSMNLALILSESYPASVKAKSLMIRLGLPLHSDPQIAFTSLCNFYLSINRVLPAYGWQVNRTGGTPDDFYSLRWLKDE